MTLGKVGRMTLQLSGSWPTSLGQAGSDSGLGCLRTLGGKLGCLPPLPGLDSFLGRRKAWLPGTWGRTGVGFLLPNPQVAHYL